MISSLTSTCRRHDINPQRYLTQLLANLPDTPISRVEEWLPDQWKLLAEQPPSSDPASATAPAPSTHPPA